MAPLTISARRRPAWARAAMIAISLSGAWLANIGGGGARHVPPHLFYVPILLTAAWFGPWSVGLASVVATLVAGPMLPADVASGSAQMSSDWLMRGVFFVTLGQLMGVLVRSLRAAEARDKALSDRELAMAAQKTAIVQGLAHELRTPLAVLSGASALLSDPTCGDAEHEKLWAAHRRALQRLETLVEVAVVLSDADRRSNLQTFQVGTIVQRQVESISRRDTGRVSLTAGGQEWVTADLSLVGLLLRIVIDNALRFSPDGEPVEVSASREGESVRVRVDDRGPGLDAHEGASLTDPFVQGSVEPATVSGLGLGLSAASRIVEVLGTDLTFTRRPGGGTTISFSLAGAAQPCCSPVRVPVPLGVGGLRERVGSVGLHEVADVDTDGAGRGEP